MSDVAERVAAGTRPDVGEVAEAIYRACHSEWRGFIPRSIELRYHRMAEAALATAGYQPQEDT